MKTKLLSLLSILVLLFTLQFAIVSPVMAQAAILDAVATPSMLSLFGDDPAASRNLPLGPNWTHLVVKTGGTTTAVTANLRTLTEAMLPSDMRSRVLASKLADWDTWMASLENVALTKIGTTDVWTKKFSPADDILSRVPPYLPSKETRRVVFEDLRLAATNGRFAVTITGQPGAVTRTMYLTIVDAQIPLRSGWNVRSAPIACANNTVAQIASLGDGLSYDAALRYAWDTSYGQMRWRLLTDSDALDPLEAFYIHMTAPDQMGAILSRTNTAPPLRYLYPTWGLIGLAPDPTLYANIVYGTTGLRGLMPAYKALTDAYYAPGSQRGYTRVISIGEGIQYAVAYSYDTTLLGTSYTWRFGQPGWSYLRDDAVSTDPMAAGLWNGWMVPFGGYWVYMDNASQLGGFSLTPIQDHWISRALAIFAP